MNERPGRLGALQRFCAPNWPGTANLLNEVAEESEGPPGWRLRRAAMAHAAKPGPHMTAEQFKRWLAEGKVVARKSEITPPHLDLGFSKREPSEYSSERPIPLPVALACAHWTFRLPLPCIPLAGAFEPWFTPRFHQTTDIAAYLGVTELWLSERLRGYAVRDGRQVERNPSMVLVRALDWVHTVGPFNPWSDQPAQCFPEV